MMRAIVDAGLHDDEWCRAHTDGYDELLDELGRTTVEECAAQCGVDAETIARVGREFASTRPALLRLGVGAQRHAGAPAAYATVSTLPLLTGAWRDRGGGFSYIPTATAGAISSAACSSARISVPLRCERSTCHASARHSPTPRWTRR